MYVTAWIHKVRSDEIRTKSPAKTGERATSYELDIRDPRINLAEAIELYVKGSLGWEPADGFSRMGNDTVFRKIRLEEGAAYIEFGDRANQIVHDPTGMKLKFFVRPTLEQLVNGT